MLDTVRQNIHFGLRTLRRNRGFALVMVLTLALGTGANTAIFSVAENVMLKPLPYPHDDELVELWSTGGIVGGPKTRMSLSYQQVQDLSGLHSDFRAVAAYTQTRFNLTGEGEPREVQAALASPALFEVLGVHPAFGRGFTPSDLREPVVVLSHGLWLQLFGDDTGAVGRVVTLDGKGYTVVGVMPAGFTFPDQGTQLWAPLGLAFVTRPEMQTNPNYHALDAIARLQGGIGMRRLQSDLAVIAARRNTPLRSPERAQRPQAAPGSRIATARGPQAAQEARHPRAAQGAQGSPAGGVREMRMEIQGGPPPGAEGSGKPQVRMGRAQPPGFAATLLRNEAVGDARTPLLVLLAVVGFVLIIACVNAANLLLARSSARQRELAVRRALGAGRGRLAGQLLTESVLLALAGGAVGLLFAEVGVSVILRAWPAVLPRTHSIGLDAVTLGYAFLISLVTGLAFGLAPAVRSSTVTLDTSLREGSSTATAGRRRHRLQRGLVVAEIALALVVLTGAGLLVRSFVRLRSIDPGYDTHDVLTARIRLTPARYGTKAQQMDFYKRVVQELGRQPGVESASVSRTLPMSGQVQMLAIDPRTIRPDDPEPFLAMGFGIVGPGFFRTLHIPLLAGRTFTADDREDTQPVAVINAALAKRLWPNENPIGRTMKMPRPGKMGGKPADIMIVGEIGNVHYASLTDPVKPEVYFPFAQAGSVSETGAWVIARSVHDPLGLAAAVRRSVEAIDPQQPVATLTTLGSMVSRSTAARSFNMTLVGIFALLALGLAVVGIYGVTAYTVEQRTQEIGVRVALGAARRNVLRLMLVETAVTTTLGIGIGLAGALAATRVLASLLYGVSTTDGTTFIVTTAVLAAAAMLAALMPALRASRIDPVQALRSE